MLLRRVPRASLNLFSQLRSDAACELKEGGARLLPSLRVQQFLGEMPRQEPPPPSPATWTRSQFVRMPDGTRQNGEKQPVFMLRERFV